MKFGLDTTAFLSVVYIMVNRKEVATEVITDNGGCFVVDRFGGGKKSKIQYHFRR